MTTALAERQRMVAEEAKRWGVDAPCVLIPRAAQLLGYTVRAIELKIARGVWREGHEWFSAPDGHRMIYLVGVAKWAARGRA